MQMFKYFASLFTPDAFPVQIKPTHVDQNGYMM